MSELSAVTMRVGVGTNGSKNPPFDLKIYGEVSDLGDDDRSIMAFVSAKYLYLLMSALEPDAGRLLRVKDDDAGGFSWHSATYELAKVGISYFRCIEVELERVGPQLLRAPLAALREAAEEPEEEPAGDGQE
jgi:hypothetical protein